MSVRIPDPVVSGNRIGRLPGQFHPVWSSVNSCPLGRRVATIRRWPPSFSPGRFSLRPLPAGSRWESTQWWSPRIVRDLWPCGTQRQLTGCLFCDPLGDVARRALIKSKLCSSSGKDDSRAAQIGGVLQWMRFSVGTSVLRLKSRKEFDDRASAYYG